MLANYSLCDERRNPVNKIKGNLNCSPAEGQAFVLKSRSAKISRWKPGILLSLSASKNNTFRTRYLCDNLDALVTSCILYISLCVILQPVLSEG